MGISLKNKQKVRTLQRARRVHRVRARMTGTKSRPRLSVHRTLKHFRVQIIDDTVGKTLVAAGDHEIKTKVKGKVARAAAVGTLIAEKAKKIGITTVMFDRRSYQYHGRVKALAEAARQGGLLF